MGIGDTSLFGFDDPTIYSGLTDTATGFSGSTTLQDVQAGSPLILDTSQGPTDTSTYDLWNLGGLGTTDVSSADNLSLSGVSDPPFASASASTPNPNATAASSNQAGGLSALSKFGSAIATLFGGTPQTTVARPGGSGTTIAGAAYPTAAVSGSTTLIVVVLVLALAMLVARGE